MQMWRVICSTWGNVRMRVALVLDVTGSMADDGKMDALKPAAKALVEKGETPPGVEPAHQRVRSVAIVLPPDQAFKDAAQEEMKVRPGLSHARV